MISKLGFNLILVQSPYIVQRETLEGSNIGEFGEKPSIRQFLNH